MKKTIYVCLCALFALTFTASKVSAQYTITSYNLYMDSVCGVENLTVAASGYTSGLSMTAYFGDGTSATYPMVSAFGSFSLSYTCSGNYTVKIVLLNAGVAIDSMSFSNTYRFCQNLFVGGYLDRNSNNVYDGPDAPIYNAAKIAIDSAGVRIDTIESLTGYDYNALGAPGTVYTFTLLSAPSGLVLSYPTSGIIYDTVLTSRDSVKQKYFAFQCATSSSFDLAVFANFSAGVTGAGSHILITNSSCTPQAATLTITYSPKFSFYYAWGYPYTVSGNTVTINVGTVSASSPLVFACLWNNVGTLTLGDTVNTKFRLTPFTGDADTSNNIIVTNDTIRTSHDPNYKSVTPSGDIAPGTKLEYMLSFENTGNAPAQNIYILDTLSANLDVSTLKIVTSSAKVNLITIPWGARTIVKFDFPNINLPDSSHHGLCDGMVAFSIKANSTLVPGNTIDNRAGIYFDNNPVVMTNGVENKIPFHTSVSPLKGTEVVIYPNPVSNELTIKTDNGTFTTATITNSIGQVMMTQQFNASGKVNVKVLPAGIYYITLRGESGIKVQKFEKL